jgi:hypothetical protein
MGAKFRSVLHFGRLCRMTVEQTTGNVSRGIIDGWVCASIFYRIHGTT